jgi:hypothetical protein
VRRPTRRARWEARRAPSSRGGRARQRGQLVAALERYVVVRESNFQFEGTGHSVDTSHGLHPLPHKRSRPTCERTTHTSRRPPHPVRTPPTATPVAALPEQLAIITEPSGLAGACRAAPEVAEVWLRNPPEAGGGVGRVFLGLDVGGRGWTRAAREGGYQRRGVVLGRVVAGVRRRVPRYRQGGHAGAIGT